MARPKNEAVEPEVTQATADNKEELKMEAVVKRQLTPDERKRELAQEYKEEEQVEMFIPPLYRPYFGNVMPVVNNGIAIYFPVDGSRHSIPKTFASIIEERRQAVDRLINKQGNMSRIAENVEHTPGELELD